MSNHETRIHRAFITEMFEDEFEVTANGVTIMIPCVYNEEDADTMLSFARFTLKVLGYRIKETYLGKTRNSNKHHFIVA